MVAAGMVKTLDPLTISAAIGLVGNLTKEKTPPPPPKKDNTLLIVGVSGAFLLIIVLLLTIKK